MADRVLLVLAHYFKAEASGVYSSTVESQRPVRKAALERVLTAWRGLFGPRRVLNIEHKAFQPYAGEIGELDIVILVNGDRHLLDQSMLSRYQIKVHNVSTDNPRLLPFGAHKLIQRHADEYDWFVYSEDDLVPNDPAIFRKQNLFQKHFGSHRVLQPNRYELNATHRAVKTFVDGPLRDGLVQGLWQYVQEDHLQLNLQTDLGPVHFERARNPHAGFFMLSKAQAQHWVKQPHFMDMDCSFVSPLESAGSLSLLKTFSLYKAVDPSFSFFEIEHQDQKFSSLRLPEM